MQTKSKSAVRRIGKCKTDIKSNSRFKKMNKDAKMQRKGWPTDRELRIIRTTFWLVTLMFVKLLGTSHRI